MAATQYFGPHNTPLTTIENTAMASWSGFVYQGLCALYHALTLLRDDWDNAIGKFLSLEAYEDFAILDNKGMIESFHQCKCYATPTNFTNECEKMEDKEYYWRNVKKNLSSTYKAMYFHSNQVHTLACGVIAYPFTAAHNKCGPFDIYALIEITIEEIVKQKGFPGSCEVKKNELILLISEQVSYIHQQCIKNPGNSFNIAASHPIPFSVIADKLKNPSSSYTIDDRILTCRYFLIVYLKERLLRDPRINPARINDFIDRINSLSIYKSKELIRRIFPDIDILAPNLNIADITNKQRANQLFNVINDTSKPINLDSFDWSSEDGMQTPSTIGSDMSPENYCVDIVNNPYSHEIRRDYRWIIGDVRYTVDNIDEAAKQITQIGSKDYSDVTQTGLIGLKDIKTKNDEDNK